MPPFLSHTPWTPIAADGVLKPLLGQQDGSTLIGIGRGMIAPTDSGGWSRAISPDRLGRDIEGPRAWTFFLFLCPAQVRDLLDHFEE